MKIILRCPCANVLSGRVDAHVGAILPIITASITDKNSLGIDVLNSSANEIISLSLLHTDWSPANYILGTTEIDTRNGTSYFCTISITSPGNFLLIASCANKKITFGLLELKIELDYSNLTINLFHASSRLLPNQKGLFVFSIVDHYKNIIPNKINNQLPPIILGINHIPYIAKVIGYSKLENTIIYPDKNGIYHFVFSSNDPGLFHIYLASSNYYTSRIQKTIFNFHYYLEVILSNNATETFTDRTNYQFDYGLIESIYLARKVYLNNHSFKGRPIKELTPYETGLSSSTSLSYKIKKPQEHSSVPHRVDNSRGTVVPGIPFFNPRIRPSFPRSHKHKHKFIIYDYLARGLNSATQTNMIKEYTIATGPDPFNVHGALTESDIILKDRTNAITNLGTDPLTNNKISISDSTPILPRLPQTGSTTGSSSSETNTQKYRAIFGPRLV